MSKISPKKIITELNQERDSLMQKIHKIDAVIEAHQAICNHKWVSDGHDSHYSYVKCSICGETEKE